MNCMASKFCPKNKILQYSEISNVLQQLCRIISPVQQLPPNADSDTQIFLKNNCLNGRYPRNIDWKLVDLINPRTFLFSRVDGPESLPHCTVTLESRTECNLPCSVSHFDPPFGLSVSQLIPK